MISTSQHGCICSTYSARRKENCIWVTIQVLEKNFKLLFDVRLELKCLTLISRILHQSFGLVPPIYLLSCPLLFRPNRPHFRQVFIEQMDCYWILPSHQLLVLPADIRIFQRLRQEHLLVYIFRFEREGRREYILEEEIVFRWRELVQTHLYEVDSLITDPLRRVDHMRCNSSDNRLSGNLPQSEILNRINQSHPMLIQPTLHRSIKYLQNISPPMR